MKIALRPKERITSTQAGVIALSAAAAATAVWVQHKARRAERENPPKGKYIYVDGVRLHYLMRGEGPPVLLLHGNTVTYADFEASRLIDRLARNHLVLAFDRPGFGHSGRPRDRLWTAAAQAALIRRALVGLGIERPVVFGHSMGAAVAVAMALDYPASVSHLVLAGGYYYPTMRLDALLTAPGALPVLGDVLRYTSMPVTARLMLNSVVKKMFDPMPVPSDFLEVLSREMLLRPSQLRANAEDAAFMMPQARALSKRYHELRVPTTLIAGSADQVVDTKAHSERLHAELPHSELHLVPGAGHMVHYAVPDLIISAIEKSVSGSRQQPPVLERSDERKVQRVDEIKGDLSARNVNGQLAHAQRDS